MELTNLRELAVIASKNAYSPYSKAFVGSALQTSDGTTYTGCNIENASYGGTICAERVAILKAVSDKKLKIKKIYVYTKEGWPPCGLCRQVMSEFADSDLEVIIGDEAGKETKMSFKELMPLSFTPDHLNK
ncbi:MAG: cytidine deaminase [Bacteriovorax sp.]|jgi:cytidine deaminase|nr:cytidine deaminase [Bacteriovorax sp.]